MNDLTNEDIPKSELTISAEDRKRIAKQYKDLKDGEYLTEKLSEDDLKRLDIMFDELNESIRKSNANKGE